MSRLVKTSKYRHTQPTPLKTGWTKIKPAQHLCDTSNFMSANDLYWAMAWASTGGGKLALFSHDKPGQQEASGPPCIVGHTGPIIDFQFHPFDSSFIATASEDTTIKLWQIPEGGLEKDMTEPAVTHSGHAKKVGILSWHPSACHVLASASADNTIKIWDMEKGERQNIAVHSENILSCNWNLDGSLLNTTSKDKKLRLIDPRSNQVATEVGAHLGTKTQRSIWAKRRNQIVTVGFSANSRERELMIWDASKMDAPLYKKEIDNASGVMMLFFDEDTNLLFVGGKGDGTVRYYELWDEAVPITELDAYSSSQGAKGLGFLPKTALKVKECEVARMIKLEPTQAQAISFKLPRKTAASEFQADVYPATFAREPALTANEYFGGKTEPPKTVDMQPLWENAGSPASSVTASTRSAGFKASADKLVTDKDIATAEEKVKKIEADLEAAQKAVEELKAKQQEQNAVDKKEDA